jgi:hypothetical protein
MEEAAINVMKDTAGTAEVSFNLKNMILYISTFCVNFADDPK